MKKKRSITIPQQLRKVCPVCDHYFIHTVPYGHEAEEKIKEFNLYQILESKLTGTKKERSIKQLNLYWKVCEVFGEMVSDHNNIFKKEDVDFDIKITIAKNHPALIKRFINKDGMTYIQPISTKFANMKHLEACKYYDYAFKEMAKRAKMTKDELIIKAKEKMR